MIEVTYNIHVAAQILRIPPLSPQKSYRMLYYDVDLIAIISHLSSSVNTFSQFCVKHITRFSQSFSAPFDLPRVSYTKADQARVPLEPHCRPWSDLKSDFS
jgi:hypothetical protein